MNEREEWEALVESDSLHLLPDEALIASIKHLAGRLLELTPVVQAQYWHAYQTDITDALEDQLGAAMAFTVIVDSRKEVPPVHLGTVLGHELTFRYLCSWDHEPSEAEREKVQLDQLAKEREDHDITGSGGEPDRGV